MRCVAAREFCEIGILKQSGERGGGTSRHSHRIDLGDAHIGGRVSASILVPILRTRAEPNSLIHRICVAIIEQHKTRPSSADHYCSPAAAMFTAPRQLLCLRYSLVMTTNTWFSDYDPDGYRLNYQHVNPWTNAVNPRKGEAKSTSPVRWVGC